MSVLLLRADAAHMPIRSESIDAIICDPPYGIQFGQLAWDTFKTDPTGRMRPFPQGSKESKQQGRVFRAWCEVWAAEALRVLKPGGWLVAFGAARAWHNLATGIEDSGFDLRDVIGWIYSSGFPKSLSADKAIDRHLGAERSKVRIPAKEACNPSAPGRGQKDYSVNGRPWMMEAQEKGYYETWSDEPATPEAAQWKGWGTALRPSIEPAIVARKPMPGTLAANLLEHGTGALNVDGGRLPMSDDDRATINNMGGYGKPSLQSTEAASGCMLKDRPCIGSSAHDAGRWPPNVVCYGPELGRDSKYYEIPRNVYRCAKPSGREKGAGKKFPTVKPLDLMRWLVRLFAAPGAIVLDPFLGSGTTGVAAVLEGRRFIGIDKGEEQPRVASARLAWADAIDSDGEPVFEQQRIPGLSAG